jgi:anti-sigma regulatory factor (Ser/Thr protein kinase)
MTPYDPTPISASTEPWLRFRYPAKAPCIRHARTEAGAVASLAVASAARREELVLLVSELVTNAIQHTDTRHVVVAFRIGEPLRVQVEDEATNEPVLDAARQVGGWGLQLLDRFSSAWGVSPLPRGKAVWFELSTRDAPSA